MDYHYDDVADQAEDHSYRKPLEEELPRFGKVQEVWFRSLFLVRMLLREWFTTGSKTCCQ